MSYTSKTIKIPAFDGDAFAAYIAIPEDTDHNSPKPAIILIQEIFGVNAEMRAKCDEYAKAGYIAICPDLFWRIQPGIELVDSIEEQLQQAFQLFGEFDQDYGIKDLKTTLGYMRNFAGCNGKVACIGYCLGGKLAYMMSVATDVDASVGYYGVALETMLDDADKIKTPLLLHIAGEDEFVNEAAQKMIIEKFADNTLVETYQYPGLNHAFARGNGMHYNEEGAILANSRTTDFLKKHLS